MTHKLKMTGRQHSSLFTHLFPGDGCEAVAIALCGRRVDAGSSSLLVHKIVPIPHKECHVRNPDRITWPTDRLLPLLGDAAKQGLAILKIHSHPGWYAQFSRF